MIYLPNNTYKNISPLDLRYNAILRELVFQSREVKNLREQAASFDESESEMAKRKLKKVIKSIIEFRANASA